jgi:hypothetical protein
MQGEFMNWIVKLETASPGDWVGDQAPLFKILQTLASYSPTGWLDREGWSIQIKVEACDAFSAFICGLTIIFAASKLSGLPRLPIVSIRIVEAEYEAVCE